MTFTIGGLDDSSRALALESPIYKLWRDTLDPRMQVTHVKFLSLVKIPRSEKVLLLYLSVTFKDSRGTEMTHSILLRGRGVLILALLASEGVEYAVLVKQARIAVGQPECYELPGGTVSPEGYLPSAVTELLEETGIHIGDELLIDLTGLFGAADGVLSSPGLLDDRTRILAFRKEVTPQELVLLEDRVAGSSAEDEHTHVVLLPLQEAIQTVEDAKSKLGLLMYAAIR